MGIYSELEATLLAVALEPIGEAVYQTLKDLEMEQFFVVLGAVLDRWEAHHGKTQEEMNNMLNALIVIREEVHGELGPYRED